MITAAIMFWFGWLIGYGARDVDNLLRQKVFNGALAKDVAVLIMWLLFTRWVLWPHKAIKGLL